MFSAYLREAGFYDPSSPQATEMAREADMSWDFRGHAISREEYEGRDGPIYYGNQKLRPDGRYANSGGFLKRIKLVHRASQFDWKFCPRNRHGSSYACISSCRRAAGGQSL